VEGWKQKSLPRFRVEGFFFVKHSPEDHEIILPKSSQPADAGLFLCAVTDLLFDFFF